MLQNEIRQARIDLGLSQAELARVAGVPRERLRQLETGGNVTLETLQKVLAQLPNLKTITLGATELQTRGATGAEVRDVLAEWLEVGRRLLTMLENAPPAPEAEDMRIRPGGELSPELEQRIRRLEARYSQPEPKET